MRPPTDRAQLLAAAVDDNVRWVAAVARALGVPEGVRGGVWAAGAATPDGYPEAVTTAPGARAADVLAALPTGAAVRSVKDSFADVDLSRHGFGVLLEGRWTAHPPPAADPAAAAAWWAVREGPDLDAWRAARVAAGAPTAPALPRLLAEPGVALLGRGPRDAPDAWAVATVRRAPVRGARVPVVGASSVGTAGPGATDRVWPGLLAALARLAPGSPVVGWDEGEPLEAALAAGAVGLGPLRVWVEGL